MAGYLANVQRCFIHVASDYLGDANHVSIPGHRLDTNRYAW